MLTRIEKAELIYLDQRRRQSAARNDFLEFVRYTKPNYEVNWHHRDMCAKLEDFARGKIKRLILQMPPRHGKSELGSRRLPAYIFGRNPNHRIIATSYGADLASMMNRDVQRVIDDEAYRELFPKTNLFGKNVRSTAKGNYLRNSDIFEIVNHQGYYRSAGIGGGISGMGANFFIIDDPVKDQKTADSIAFRNTAWDWYASTAYSRLAKDAGILIILTRWHEDDIVGRILQIAKNDPQADQWELVRYPAILEKPERDDPRMVGEALWPDEFPASQLLKAKKNSPRIFEAVWQQNPTSPEGALVKRKHIKFWKALPDKFDEIIMSWDFAQTDTDKADYTVCQVWGRLGANKYLIDQLRDRLDFPAECQAVVTMSAKHPKAYVKVVEKKSNGDAVIQTLSSKVPGIVAYSPKESKKQRLKAVSPDYEAGNIYYPHPDIAPWVHDTIEEVVNFPNAANDDTVDATTQALIRFRADSADEFTAELSKRGRGTITGKRNLGDKW